MTLKLNGITLGELKPERRYSGGWQGDGDERIGPTNPVPYATGRLPTSIRLEFTTQAFNALVTALTSLLDNGEGVYYLSDTNTSNVIYAGSQGVWVTHVVYDIQCDHLNQGSGSISCLVTTDHQDSTYTP